MKTKFFSSVLAFSNMAVILLFALIFLGGTLMAQPTAKISRDYWHPDGSQRVVFVQFSDSVRADYVLAYMDSLNFKPATLDNLMAYHISTYSSFPSSKIVALGSRFDGLTGYDYIPYSDSKAFVLFRYDENMWDTSFVFMGFKNKNDKLSFETLEHYFKYTADIVDNDSSDLFVSEKYHVIMWQEYHASVDVSDKTWMNEFVLWHITYEGQIINIPYLLSYQSVLDPRIINDNIVFKAVDRGGINGFYTVIPLYEGMYRGDAYNVMSPKTH